MSNNFIITRIWSDEHLIELLVNSSTDFVSSSIKFYTNTQRIIEVANTLREWFPRKIGDSLEFEFGDFGQSHIGYLLLKFKTRDIRGHLDFNIVLSNNTGNSDSYNATMTIPTTIPCINRLGLDLVNLCKEDGEVVRLLE